MERLFPLLKADQIECRVAQCGGSNGRYWASLLLYKTARVDMDMLDEVFGPMNWMRSHTRDNANCIISVWDKEKGMWIGKEDTGTESNTEAQKGLASDSFKRAGFLWGIGRELYTAPHIFVNLTAADVKDNNGRIQVKQCFKIKKIDYDEKGRIDALLIVDKDGKTRYEYDTSVKQEVKRATTQSAPRKISDAKVNTVLDFIAAKGVDLGKFLSFFNVNEVEDMTEEQYEQALTILKRKKDV